MNSFATRHCVLMNLPLQVEKGVIWINTFIKDYNFSYLFNYFAITGVHSTLIYSERKQKVFEYLPVISCIPAVGPRLYFAVLPLHKLKVQCTEKQRRNAPPESQQHSDTVSWIHLSTVYQWHWRREECCGSCLYCSHFYIWPLSTECAWIW
jgi:hypothetical protein